MTAKSYMVDQGFMASSPSTETPKYTWEEILMLMEQYAYIKSKEASRNTRYAAIEICNKNTMDSGDGHQAVDGIAAIHQIQNIQWKDVSPFKSS